MKKTDIMEHMGKYEKCAEDSLLYGYPRSQQEEITKVSHAILDAICNQNNVTVQQAKYALKMATEILDVTAKYETIS